MKPIKKLLLALLSGLIICGTARAEVLLSPTDQIIGGIVDATNFIEGLSGTTGGVNNWPGAEPPEELIDGFHGGGGAKYLNFFELNTGAIITPAAGPSVVTSMTLWTANDAEPRDPATYELYGTNVPITKAGPGSTYARSDFTLISEGPLSLPSTRSLDPLPIGDPPYVTGNLQTLPIVNGTSYTSYMIIFPTVKDAASANSMQVSELALEGTTSNIATVTAERSGIDFFEIDVTDIGTSVLDPASISLTIDGVDVTPDLTVTKDGTVTTIRHDQSPQWLYDQVVPFEFNATDTDSEPISRESNFTVPGADISVVTGLNFVEFTVVDQGSAVLDEGSIAVVINGVDESAGLSISKVGDVTTIRHEENPQFAFGSTVTYSLTAMDSLTQDLELSGQFTVTAPFFPFGEDLLGAEDLAVDGNWGVRYIWGAGTLNDLETVLAVIEQAANDPDNFPGTIVDTSEPFMNHSDNGTRFMGQPDLPYHSDAIAAGLPADDFILYGVGCLRITEAGDYTIGVHSDDGFGVRIHGFNFTESFGGDGRDPRNGTIDPVSSDTIIHPTVTGDSNTRAIATDVQPGVYRDEFGWWERAGGDHGEIYIAKGQFPNDTDTIDWQLIGDPNGFPLVSKGEDFRITEIVHDTESDQFTLTWTSRPNENYTIVYDVDLEGEEAFAADVEDSIPSGGETTTFGPFDNPIGGATRLFFRVIR